MAKSKFQHRQNLLYEDMHVLYHSSHAEISIVQMHVPSVERRKVLNKHPYYYVTIANTVYFKVPTADLSPVTLSTNRAAAYLLEGE